MITDCQTRSGRARGQVLPLFALFLVVLLGFSALAIDVSNAYASRRFYRAVADAAALAGAQDLQTTTRDVTTTQQTAARTDAFTVLQDRLGASGPPAGGTCNSGTTGDFSKNFNACPLPGTDYMISIKTPSPTCVSCDGTHAIQITVDNPKFSLSFSRVFGVATWNVNSTSVAGLAFAAKYALMTLQPPNLKNNGTDANLNKDMIVNGQNTLLNIIEGDVGTNTSATTTNMGYIKLADGYFIDHYDDLTASGLTWSQVNGSPVGQQISSLINDPNYMYPSFAGAPSFATQAAGKTPCSGADFPTDYATLLPTASTTCYLPGKYTDNQPFTVASTAAAYLMPGAYYFPSGMSINGTLAGGLVTGRSGVVLQFDESNTKILSGNSAVNILLNMGSSTCSSDTCRADPALDWASAPVKTPEGLALTIEVTRDANCFSGTTPVLCTSDLNQNQTVNLAGNGQLGVAGVIYGPSDNMTIHANQTVQTGTVGQVVSYSVTYTGGATLNQDYPGGKQVGVVRLDAACTAPSTPCNNP